MKHYKNTSTILSCELQTTKEKLEILKNNRKNAKWISNAFLDFSTKNNYTCHSIVCDIIESLSLDINDLSKTISEEDFENYLGACMMWVDNYKELILLKFEINPPSKELVDMERREQLRYVNTILKSMYGVKIVQKTPKMYGLDDNNIWNALPREQKVIPIMLESTVITTNINENMDTSLLDYNFDDS